MRTIWRLRDRHVKDAGRAVQHMQKALTKMNVQLANVISDISGLSGQAIIHAILLGERDPFQLAELVDYRVKATREEVARSLEGTGGQTCCSSCSRPSTATISHIGRCGNAMKAGTLPGRRTGTNVGNTWAAPGRKHRTETKESEKAKGQRTTYELEGGTHTDLRSGPDSIDGINIMTAFTVISEVGTDMSRFHDENHFTSWMGLAPSKDISSGKIVGSGKKKVKNRVAIVLRTAATSLLESDTYLGARYRHLRRQLPTLKGAVKAMARHLAVLIYRLLTHGRAWVDRGAAQFERKRLEREVTNLHAKARANGFTLVPIAEAH